MADKQLKRCPFCNSDKVFAMKPFSYADTFIVGCSHCGARMSEQHNEAKAIERWNKRGDDWAPKVDRKVLCAQEAINRTSVGLGSGVTTAIRAIELWESGFGK